MTKISVITVCFNSQHTIKETFNSLLFQTYTEFEYIVIDGASTDNTVETIKEYAPLFQKANITFKWISEPDKGIYDAMNKGIDMCSGEIIGILNSDDQYMPWTLETIKNISEQYPEIDVYHGLLRHVTHGKLTKITGISSDDLKNHMIEHPTCFVKKKVYNELGKFNVKYKFAADYDFMLKLKSHKCSFHLIEQVLAQFDENGSGNSWSSTKEAISIRKKYRLVSNMQYIFLLIKEKIHRILKR